MGDLSEHFSRSEFACQCGCGADSVSLALVARLEKTRVLAGIPFSIRSGCRCPAHNAAVKGRPDSAHLTIPVSEVCEAVDIATPDSRTRFLIMWAAMQAGFERIEDAPTWIHLDVDKGKDQRVLFRT
jgi:hypothetical protein